MEIHSATDIGRIIRARRAEVELTATDAAQLAGVSRRLLLELEVGKRPQVGLRALLRILEILGLRVDVAPRGLPGTRPAAGRGGRV